ncbi:hypothetical protein LFL97_31910 [Burkholderia sp. JSH-S8]|nr:hypothetical protein LFL97_31910 [Burkholderia sp. JSH-S8]
MSEGKMGPMSRKIIECVKAHPGIHAGEVARKLGLGVGGGSRETIRTLISRGYLAKGKKRIARSARGQSTVTPLTYTGKPFKCSDDWAISTRWKKHQEKVVAKIEREQQMSESVVWAGAAIRAMIGVGRAAA